MLFQAHPKNRQSLGFHLCLAVAEHHYNCIPRRIEVDVGNIQEIRALSAELDRLDADIRKAAAESRKLLTAVPAALQGSATNLIHYLALRRHDLRALQPRLAAIGLSSLDAVRSVLRA
jgi:pyruvate kinase